MVLLCWTCRLSARCSPAEGVPDLPLSMLAHLQNVCHSMQGLLDSDASGAVWASSARLLLPSAPCQPNSKEDQEREHSHVSSSQDIQQRMRHQIRLPHALKTGGANSHWRLNAWILDYTTWHPIHWSPCSRWLAVVQTSTLGRSQVAILDTSIGSSVPRTSKSAIKAPYGWLQWLQSPQGRSRWVVAVMSHQTETLSDGKDVGVLTPFFHGAQSRQDRGDDRIKHGLCCFDVIAKTRNEVLTANSKESQQQFFTGGPVMISAGGVAAWAHGCDAVVLYSLPGLEARATLKSGLSSKCTASAIAFSPNSALVAIRWFRSSGTPLLQMPRLGSRLLLGRLVCRSKRRMPCSGPPEYNLIAFCAEQQIPATCSACSQGPRHCRSRLLRILGGVPGCHLGRLCLSGTSLPHRTRAAPRSALLPGWMEQSSVAGRCQHLNFKFWHIRLSLSGPLASQARYDPLLVSISSHLDFKLDMVGDSVSSSLSPCRKVLARLGDDSQCDLVAHHIWDCSTVTNHIWNCSTMTNHQTKLRPCSGRKLASWNPMAAALHVYVAWPVLGGACPFDGCGRDDGRGLLLAEACPGGRITHWDCDSLQQLGPPSTWLLLNDRVSRAREPWYLMEWSPIGTKLFVAGSSIGGTAMDFIQEAPTAEELAKLPVRHSLASLLPAEMIVILLLILTHVLGGLGYLP